MNLGIGALPAEIAVEARQPRWRLEAPAVVLKAFRREIEAPFSAAYAVLQRAADPTDRLDFDAIGSRGRSISARHIWASERS
jgi:hypothetical protein